MDRSKFLDAIIENAIDGIITIDDKGFIEHLNPAALKLFGYERTELVGKNVSVLMPEPDKIRHDGYIQNYNETGKKHIIGIGREVRGQKKDGSTFPFRLGVSEVKFSDRKIYTGFIHDLSKEKANEEQIKSYTEKLESKIKERTRDLIKLVSELETAKENMSALFQKEKELNQLKTRFVSMASHEFRTPLSSMQLSASLIDKYTVKQDVVNVEKHTAKIKNSINNLTTILNDFLSLEKLEAGKVQAAAQVFNIISFAEEITEEMQLMTKQNQHIIYEHTGTKANVLLDPNLLKNCIINLISNAIKYSGEDTLIQFNSILKDNELILEVKDNGIGIPEADQHNLFEPFFRAHNTGDIPGTGLGLNIVSRYVGLMNGAVSCKSEQHSGTLFTLSFPVK
ncbi:MULTISPECIES: PAS domain-containing sensor histidine kinase [unclassified Pedobacter]|uniref:PAS domain-containing sensor histidine kinase n=1 Tax=Pedobacter TaxID=84567 RepID=UPI000B4A7EC7|nr:MULTISPECIES: PAS domain-containing sensor histidine kinase [unclassified Pedobacter]MCX2433451.1 PAS domain-containing sensor histidine kinase [Pedobacter sp. GR22-10]MCX2585175.1 PAS domain-containing sensor histidine kinase [Pedobacter sp. MR22-3]OWK68888.1 PAS domain-containing sensor histidine kinase [Pedobacter sp. AJM]